MDIGNLVFYGLAALITLFSVMVLLESNPIMSALYLALSMVGLSFLFFQLQAYFIAGVQLVVYAGAVMVLFVMVLMLFDLKNEDSAFTKGKLSGFLKISAAGLFAGMVLGAAVQSVELFDLEPIPASTVAHQVASTKQLGILLFTKYLLAFEVLGLLLLLIAIGAVALARMKGGTHAKS
ncbi:MAG: NADH-quinone oxidoreductase subunit J [Pseudobdellovibrionaceae bacterium]|nr:NADH-quinone oxidoreductase subunit J [Bdellovibrionales bacterium]USN46869.1 MAG: NADH-quinone oxidoreductase subunit J [Pseudobdellovibrionaceae bacterium]